MKKLSMILIVIILSIAHGCATVNLEGYYQDGLRAKEVSDKQAAMQKWEVGLAQARIQHDQQYVNKFLLELAEIYWQQKRLQTALETYEELVRLARELSLPSQEANAFYWIGRVYERMKESEKALEFYEQALAVIRPLNNFREEGEILNRTSEGYRHLGKFQQAKEFAEQALTLAPKTGYYPIEMTALHNLGYAHEGLEQPQKAIESFQKAVSKARQRGYYEDLAHSLWGLGYMYSRHGKQKEVPEAWEEAVILFRKYTDARFFLMELLADLGRIYWRLEEYQQAVESYEQAIDMLEAFRVGFTDSEQIDYLQRYMYIYDDLIELFETLHYHYKKDPDKGYHRKALEMFERKQGRLFINEMGKSGARRFAGVPDAILEYMFDVEHQLEAIHGQITTECRKPPEEARFQLISRSFENLRDDGMPESLIEQLRPLENKNFIKDDLLMAVEAAVGQESAKTYNELILEHIVDLLSQLVQRESMLKAEQTTLQKQLKTEYPDYYALQYPQPVSSKELQQRILRPGELLLVYGMMRNEGILWVINCDAFHMFTVFMNERTLQRNVDALRMALRVEYEETRGLPTIVKDPDLPEQSFIEISHDLYTRLIPEEISPLLAEAQSVTIVPTGPLYALPFEALVTNPAPAPHYLIEDIPIKYLSSASLLKILREAEARRTVLPIYPLLAFADPVYGPTPEGNKEHARRTQAYRAFFEEGFTELPETAEEANAIATLLNAPQESEPLQLREQASRSNVFAFHDDGRLDEYRYLVFATHGVLPGDIDQITQPALVLSYPEQEGYLTMADVFQLKCNADLISLSACNTGMGEHQANEGVIGLTRSFMYAGTSAVTVTLWSVESQSAKELDVGLFEHLAAGESPAHALRSAKLSLLRGEKGERYQHPYYWAPFVLFGDGL